MGKSDEIVKIFNTYALGYQDKYMNLERYHQGLDLFLNFLKTDKPHILDIACGPGNVANYLINRNAELEYLGLDLAPEMVKLAIANNPTASFQKFDCLHLDRLEGQYGGVICAFLIPYLSMSEVRKMITDINGLLLDNGVVYLSTMEADFNKSAYQKSNTNSDLRLFTYYYSIAFLKETLEQNGLKILYEHRVKQVNIKTSTSTHDIILIASKATRQL